MTVKDRWKAFAAKVASVEHWTAQKIQAAATWTMRYRLGIMFAAMALGLLLSVFFSLVPELLARFGVAVHSFLHSVALVKEEPRAADWVAAAFLVNLVTVLFALADVFADKEHPRVNATIAVEVFLVVALVLNLSALALMRFEPVHALEGVVTVLLYLLYALADRSGISRCRTLIERYKAELHDCRAALAVSPKDVPTSARVQEQITAKEKALKDLGERTRDFNRYFSVVDAPALIASMIFLLSGLLAGEISGERHDGLEHGFAAGSLLFVNAVWIGLTVILKKEKDTA